MPCRPGDCIPSEWGWDSREVAADYEAGGNYGISYSSFLLARRQFELYRTDLNLYYSDEALAVYGEDPVASSAALKRIDYATAYAAYYLEDNINTLPMALYSADAQRQMQIGELIGEIPASMAVFGAIFAKAGIDVTDHFVHRLAQRQSRGVTEQLALRAYDRGRVYYDNESRNYARYDPQTGVIVIVDKPADGTAITVYEGNPSPDWNPVPWRPGRE